MKIPAVFLSHGAPTLAVEDGSDTKAWAELAAKLPQPDSILVISAHWDTEQPAVSAAPELAKEVARRIELGGMACDVDNERGLDHGAWVPLKWMYPGAEIPVAQLSVQ